jgi:hypothetical protein
VDLIELFVKQLPARLAAGFAPLAEPQNSTRARSGDFRSMLIRRVQSMSCLRSS